MQLLNHYMVVGALIVVFLSRGVWDRDGTRVLTLLLQQLLQLLHHDLMFGALL